MKICLDVRPVASHFPGIGRCIHELCQALPGELGADDRVQLLINPQQSSAEWIDTLVGRCGFRVSQVAPAPFSAAQLWRVPRTLRPLKLDLYHRFTAYVPYWTGIPTILTVHDLIPILLPACSTPRARLFFRLNLALALQSAWRVITYSDATRRDILKYYKIPTDKLRTFPLAVGAAFHPPTPAEIEQARGKFGLPENYILYLGSNRPHKNLGRLVEAWASLASRPAFKDRKLVIAGYWEERFAQPRQLSARLNAENSIRFLGAIPEEDLRGLYGGARVFVFPSLYEGFGLPVLEAMACGAAVACSRTSSLPEVAGEAAIYFDPTDPQAIASALKQALEDDQLLEKLRQRGLVRAGLFSWQQTARQTVQVYREISSITAV